MPRVLALMLLLPGLLTTPVLGMQAQNLPPRVVSGSPEISKAQIDEQLSAIEARGDLDDATIAKARELLSGGLEQLQQAGKFSERAGEFRRSTENAPQLLSTIRAELAQPPSDKAIVVPEDATLVQLEQQLQQATTDLQTKRQQLRDLQDEAARRTERRPVLTEQLVKARQDLDSLSSTINTTTIPPEDANPDEHALAVARRTQQLARQRALRLEIEAMEAELASYDARQELLPARRDKAQRDVSDAEKRVTAWQDVVTQKRQAEADRAAVEAQRLRREAARQHPVLKEYADETAERAQSRAGPLSTNERIAKAQAQLITTQTRLRELDSGFRSMQALLDASGLNRATGLKLRREYDGLPDPKEIKRRLSATVDTLEDIEYQLIELQDEREGAGDIDRVAKQLLADIPEGETSTNRADLEQVARELAAARRDLLDKLIADKNAYAKYLTDLSGAQRDELSTVTAYDAYIRERILWVRSIGVDRGPRLGDLGHALSWLLDPAAWKATATTWLAHAKSDLTELIGIALLLVLVWFQAIRSGGRLRDLSERVSRYKTDAFYLTLLALLLTLLMALPVSASMYALGWAMTRPPEQTEIALSLGSALMSGAWVLLPLMVLRASLRSNGLAVAHFRWSETATKSVRRNLRWFIPLFTPLVVLVLLIDSAGDEAANASLGRLLLSVMMAALSMFLYRVLRPHGTVLKGFLEEHEGGWVYRLRNLWFPLAVLLPLAFATLSWLGFHYTALQLEGKLEHTLVLMLVLVLANGVMLRWLFIARRRVAVEDARRRRAQAAAEAEAKGESPQQTKETLPVVDEDKVDLPSISGQTRELFRAALTISVVLGVYLIWAESMPALRMLDRVQIWPSVQILETADTTPMVDMTPAAAPERATDGSAGSASGNGTSPSPSLMPGSGLLASGASAEGGSGDGRDEALLPAISITVADLGLAIVILIATSIAFRNVPGLLEIIVIQRLPLDAGSRYAMSTVLKYIIAIVGVIVAFNTLGLAWDKVQWLAAALTFGLAFGLQEIFANFVSGLIILAERPIRIGDTVTVGGITGTVTKIRMRATTISDWDRKELVIPNKNFITGEVVNWSLSDPVLRVTIPVGVSYSSDVDKVSRLLQEIADRNRVVLADPAPQIVFKGFGDSTLNFELRVFIPSIEHLVPIRNDMHMAIFKRFRAESVEIAFPQRDLNIRSIGDFSKLIREDASGSQPDSDDLDGVETEDQMKP